MMYSRPRLIPALTMINRGLVKTQQFKKPRYIGDPINTVKIFNNKGVDELCILDIRATTEKRGPDFEYLKEIASEAFMPLSYGGGITTLEEIEQLFYIGYEKVILNTAFIENPKLIQEAVAYAGSQSVVVSIDIKKTRFKGLQGFIHAGKESTKADPVSLAKLAESLGAGEILLTSIDHEGLTQGYDLELIKAISNAVNIPVIANGGAATIQDFKEALDVGAHAVAASSLFVFYGRQKAVLITAPEEKELIKLGIFSPLE